MKADQYKAERKRRGTQASVAKRLHVLRGTVARRETGKTPITREAGLALLSLRKDRYANENEQRPALRKL